jgi:hypothetical protein
LNQTGKTCAVSLNYVGFRQVSARWLPAPLAQHDKQIAGKKKERKTSLAVVKSELNTGEIHGKSQKEQQH